jgi:Na+-transporting NADH:ubiquinone oxidoreductase subunit NqrC
VPRSIWYSVVVSYISSILLVASSIIYMNHVDTESNRKWCSLILFIDHVNKTTPPSTEISKQYAAYVHQLVNDFDC